MHLQIMRERADNPRVRQPMVNAAMVNGGISGFPAAAEDTGFADFAYESRIARMG